MRPRISIRGFVRPSVRRSVRPSVGPSVRPSVRPLRLCKNRVSRLFLATVRSYTETNDQPTCFESLLYYSVVSPVCSSICLSVYVTWSIHAETQSGRIFARSGLFSFFFFVTLRLAVCLHTIFIFFFQKFRQYQHESVSIANPELISKIEELLAVQPGSLQRELTER